jgi:O-antigen ligase
VSSIGVLDAGRAAGFLGITAYLMAFGLWLAAYVDRPSRAAVVLRGYLFAAVASALIGVLALYVPLPAHDLLTEDQRARALFQDPNVFGPFLVPAALLVTEELLSPRLLRARAPAKMMMLVVLVLGVVLSYSRGAWLNLAIGLIVMTAIFAIRSGGMRKAGTLVAVAVVAGVAITGVVVATGSADFLAERARPQAYDNERFGGQRAGLELAAKYPLGAGPGQFESAIGISAHSTYVRVIAEQGLLGVVVLLAFLLFTLGAGLYDAVLGRGTYGLGSAALLGAWAGLLANSFFIDTLHWRHMWVVAALIWAGSVRAAPPRRPRAAWPAATGAAR